MAAVPSAVPWSLSLREVGEVGRYPLAEAAAAAAFPTSMTVDSQVRRAKFIGDSRPYDFPKIWAKTSLG